MNAMIAFLNSLSNGTVVLLAVADEAGLNENDSCTLLPFQQFPQVEAGLKALEALGSTQIRSFCYRYSWSMVLVKGEGRSRDEEIGNAVEVSVQITLPLPLQ